MSHSHQLFPSAQQATQKKHPYITESYDITDLRAHCKPEITLALDLDNTVIEPEDHHDELGSDQWFTALCAYGSSVDLSGQNLNAAMLVLTIYSAVEHHVNLKLIQPEIRDIINEYDEQGSHVLFLTARGPEISEPTLHQLERNGIDLSLQWGDDAQEFEVEHNGKTHQRVFKNGVIFCGGLPKELCLAAVMEMLLAKDIELHQSVLMVDDKDKYLHSVIRMMLDRGGEAKGVHFRRMDDKVKNHDFPRAQQQLFAIRHKLSPEAQDAMEKLGLRQ